MRPLKLEISGFTAFRDPVEVDFEGVDYFALVGPTGAGKSSVIDAITFALYGAIARLDLRSVFPVVSQGAQEARVRFDFALGDRRLTAVRVVRKQGADKATTKEARLEEGETVLAGDADSVTTEVTRLLGLRFAEFTRCVVLPQGEFARFMHDKPSERQDLLVRLLDLDQYGRMLVRANTRGATAEAELAVQERRLTEDLAGATDDALSEARANLVTIAALRERFDTEEPLLADLRDEVRAARERAEQGRRATVALEAITVPEEILALADALAGTQAARDAAEAAAERAEEAHRAAETAVAALPDPGAIERALAAHGERERVRAESEEAQRVIVARATEVDAADAAVAAAATDSHAARGVLEKARIEHRAADLTRTLVAGDPCPVCHQTVHAVPADAPPADLATAERGVTDADERLAAAERTKATVERDHAAAAARAEMLTAQLARADEQLEAYPDPDAARALLESVAAARADAASAKTAAADARARAVAARKAAEAADAALTTARQDLAKTRDGVADLGPPPLSHTDLAEDWRSFAAWATEETAKQRTVAAEAAETAAGAEAKGRALVEAQRQACIDAGIAVQGSPRDACLTAETRATSLVERIELMLEEAATIRVQVETLKERAAVARALAGHLKSNAFERWVLRQALTTLVDGASSILLELSAGQYSLSLDTRFNFSVVDHRNADLARSAKTLSGGETFLASLALALAMSDRIAQLSANTAVRLESIFLDEGFGSLDPETLETAATTIESLGAADRVVGIVTHVRDLAERVPVRFEVRKGPSTSTIERVLA